MSLYPPEGIVDIPVTASPRKFQQHRQKRARMPSEEASRQSTNLLCAFVWTNGPRALFQAIPHYRTGIKEVGFADAANVDETVNQEMEDSPIGRDARVVGQGKDCWSLLEPNVVCRKGCPAPDPEDDTDEDELASMKSVVGSCSWSLLEAFVDAFEEDQKRSGCERVFFRSLSDEKTDTFDFARRPILPDTSHAYSSYEAPATLERWASRKCDLLVDSIL